ncbi:hypothetical protein HPP92_009893 [Vanilla planifolia]|uniref:Uncharacterized protein n=1 Tax=Vanilla planifolia TaxID=51239 RepID=A0A835V3A4_VANPL|nr:hypothetical protein HPP92_009893 [Vanilla planifolia]
MMLKHTFCSLRRPPVIPTKTLSSSALVGAVGSDSVKNMAFNLLSPSLPLQVSSHKESMTMRNSRSICSCPRNGSIQFPMSINFNIWKEFRSQSLKVALAGALALTLHLSGSESVEAKVGVNKPELLPKEFSTVIDVAGFLSDGQVLIDPIFWSCNCFLKCQSATHFRLLLKEENLFFFAAIAPVLFSTTCFIFHRSC